MKPEKMSQTSLDMLLEELALPAGRGPLRSHIAALEAERDAARTATAEEAGKVLAAWGECAALRERVQALDARVEQWRASRFEAARARDTVERTLAAIRQRAGDTESLGKAAAGERWAWLTDWAKGRFIEDARAVARYLVGEDDHGEASPNPPETPEGSPGHTTAEAFATVRAGISPLQFDEVATVARAQEALAWLERRMGVMELAICMRLDARTVDEVKAAHNAMRASLTGAPPVFTPTVPAELATLIDGFAAEVQAAEDHAQRPKGGQQVIPTGDFVRCTPSMLGRLRWWANALREGRTAVPVFTLEEVRSVLVKTGIGPAAREHVEGELTALRRTP